METPQVVDYDRLKRISSLNKTKKEDYNTITQVCILLIFIGAAVLIKRFKDKKSHLQSDIQGTLRRKDKHLFS
jgi:hypothetical protein